MNKNFDNSFKNYLMTRKLNELLVMITQEDDEEKIKQIQTVIDIRVNYLNDNNEKLRGKKLKQHIDKIKELYSGTKYFKYINISYKRKSKKMLSFFIILGIGLTTLATKGIFSEKRYEYNSIVVNRSELSSMLNAKKKLGIFYEKIDFYKSYINYQEAFKIANQVEDTEIINFLEKKVVELKIKVYLFLEKELVKLENGTLKNNEEINKIYDIAKSLGLTTIQGKWYQIQGDKLFIEGNLNDLKEIKEDYTYASKYLDGISKDILMDKIKNIDKIISINNSINQIYIKTLNSLNIDEARKEYELLNKEIEGITKTASNNLLIKNLKSKLKEVEC